MYVASDKIVYLKRVLEKNHNQKPKGQTQENKTRLGLQQEFNTHMYLNLWKQSNSWSKIHKHIEKSQVINEQNFQ
jgi:hypothetical protein